VVFGSVVSAGLHGRGIGASTAGVGECVGGGEAIPSGSGRTGTSRRNVSPGGHPTQNQGEIFFQSQQICFKTIVFRDHGAESGSTRGERCEMALKLRAIRTPGYAPKLPQNRLDLCDHSMCNAAHV